MKKAAPLHPRRWRDLHVLPCHGALAPHCVPAPFAAPAPTSAVQQLNSHLEHFFLQVLTITQNFVQHKNKHLYRRYPGLENSTMYTILQHGISKKNDCIKVGLENFSLFQYIYHFAPN